MVRRCCVLLVLFCPLLTRPVRSADAIVTAVANAAGAAEQQKQDEPSKAERSLKDEANGPGPFAAMVPDFTVSDIHGKSHTSQSLYAESGMLLMLTVPNLTQYEKQKRWHKWMKKQGWPEHNAPKCVVLEDMSQAGRLRERACSAMKEKSQEDRRLLFVLDEDGSTRRQFGVLENETVILVVDRNGHVIHHESDDVAPEASTARRVMAQVLELAEQAPSASNSVVISSELAVNDTHQPATDHKAK